MKTDVDYMQYIHCIDDNLLAEGVRILTLIEVAAIIGHLIKVVEAYPERDIGGLDLMETLAIEVSRLACELHPDLPNPSPEKITDAIITMVDMGTVERRS